MKHLTMIRHGQANSGAKDELGYDKLTTMGHQQAKWFGEHLLQTGVKFDKIYSGTQRRQIETAQGVNQFDLPHIKDVRLNELDYFGLAQNLKNRHEIPFPATQEEFSEQIKTILQYWKLGKIETPIETFETFHGRIVEVVKELVGIDEKILVVSSTGVIASLFGELLHVELEHRVKLFLAVAHTSVHRFEMLSGILTPTLFGATPHLDSPKREHARTFV
jgi:broad specificity phosphatase PhoE